MPHAKLQKLTSVFTRQWSEVHFGQRGGVRYHDFHTQFDENPAIGSKIKGGH
jgi:hypothetical protein